MRAAGGCRVVPPAVPFEGCLPPKIRELEAVLRKAGFVYKAGKGSHRKWVHPNGRVLVLSGGPGDDAKRYQEAQVAEAVAASGRKPEA